MLRSLRIDFRIAWLIHTQVLSTWIAILYDVAPQQYFVLMFNFLNHTKLCFALRLMKFSLHFDSVRVAFENVRRHKPLSFQICSRVSLGTSDVETKASMIHERFYSYQHCGGLDASTTHLAPFMAAHLTHCCSAETPQGRNFVLVEVKRNFFKLPSTPSDGSCGGALEILQKNLRAEAGWRATNYPLEVRGRGVRCSFREKDRAKFWDVWRSFHDMLGRIGKRVMFSATVMQNNTKIINVFGQKRDIKQH